MTLRDAIWHRRTTQTKVAAKAKCSFQLLSMHIRGRRAIREDYARRIARALRCELHRLNDSWDFVPVTKSTQSKASA